MLIICQQKNSATFKRKMKWNQINQCEADDLYVHMWSYHQDKLVSHIFHQQQTQQQQEKPVQPAGTRQHWLRVTDSQTASGLFISQSEHRTENIQWFISPELLCFDDFSCNCDKKFLLVRNIWNQTASHDSRCLTGPHQCFHNKCKHLNVHLLLYERFHSEHKVFTVWWSRVVEAIIKKLYWDGFIIKLLTDRNKQKK